MGEHIAGTPLCLCLENLFDHHAKRRRRFGARIGDLWDIIEQVGDERIVAAFHEIGYNGLWNLEVPGEERAPRAIRDLKLSYARRLVEHMLSQSEQEWR